MWQIYFVICLSTCLYHDVLKVVVGLVSNVISPEELADIYFCDNNVLIVIYCCHLFRPIYYLILQAHSSEQYQQFSRRFIWNRYYI